MVVIDVVLLPESIMVRSAKSLFVAMKAEDGGSVVTDE